MAAATYATDLTLIDDAEAVGNYSALGGGASALSDETDYFVENTQCVSKAGFTATTKGFILNTGTRTVASGDAVFVWSKQNNRNLIDTIANGGIQVVIGDSTSAYDQFYVDGSDAVGGSLAGWKSYAVDPTQTPSATTGSPTTTDRVGMLWKTLGSGSLKGNPNALDVSRHGRELTVIDGDLGNGYATFEGAASFDSATARAWGLLTPIQGGYAQHGAFVMGTVATAVDFRDSFRSISVLDDLFVPAGFNEFEIRNASSNVEWNNISINQLLETGNTTPSAPFILTLNVGTFAGDGCIFTGAATSVFSSTGSCTNSQWIQCGQVTGGNADLSGSKLIESTVAADEGALYWNETISTPTVISDLNNMVFTKGTNAHHAIRFGANVTDDITLEGIEFTGFSSTGDANDSTLRFDATTGSLTVTLVNCTVDGAAATSSNIGVDDAAGITVTISTDIVGTFTGMRENSEVRVYAAGTKTELAGVENATGGTTDNRSFAATIAGGTSVDYTIVNVLYEIVRVEGFTWPTAAQDISVQQRFDRNYSNP